MLPIRCVVRRDSSVGSKLFADPSGLYSGRRLTAVAIPALPHAPRGLNLGRGGIRPEMPTGFLAANMTERTNYLEAKAAGKWSIKSISSKYCEPRI